MSGAIRGTQWQSVAITCQSSPVRHNQWQSVAIRGNPWQSVAIRGNPWQSVAIRGNHLPELPGEAQPCMREPSTQRAHEHLGRGARHGASGRRSGRGLGGGEELAHIDGQSRAAPISKPVTKREHIPTAAAHEGLVAGEHSLMRDAIRAHQRPSGPRGGGAHPDE